MVGLILQSFLIVPRVRPSQYELNIIGVFTPFHQYLQNSMLMKTWVNKKGMVIDNRYCSTIQNAFWNSQQ